MQEQTDRNGLEIAVIGMSGRFPGAKNIHEFWENLKNGVNSITFFKEDEFLKRTYIDPGVFKDPNFVNARGVVEESEYFDAFFFGYSPLEAEILDPQIRIFYEVCWEALEDAGCDPSTVRGPIGVYAGGSSNRWWEVLAIITGKTKIIGDFASDYLMDKDVLSTRISYRLDLRGPAITMHTACSTSLVSVDMACRGLLTGQCYAALAGAVSVLPQTVGASGYLYREGLIYSADGYVRAFDEKANGVVFSNGTGVVLLKRLDDAVADGDDIYAVVKGFATNNDGIAKSSFTAPGVDGQAKVIRAALYMAEVESISITYVETHGTGTVIGDPIEVEALTTAFNTDKRQYCPIGSVKTNIGHLDVAAGIASFIKTVLALKHRQIPPSLNFEKPNPRIEFENSPFFVNTELREWKSNGYPLRAGVSSFGVGGTNAHIILEEAPPVEPTSPSRNLQLILLSARTRKALEQTTKNFLNYLKENPGINLADTAYTLKVGRKAFEHKRMLVCSDVKETIEILESVDNESSDPDGSQRVQTYYEKDEKRAVFMFPGQGSQYVDMALGLYETESIFREEIDRCFEIFKQVMGYDLKEILYPNIDKAAAGSGKIDQTEITQSVIFAVEYALARLLMAWGIEPYAMIGHSIGEYTAACLAGVFSLEDALTIVAWRGKLMQRMPSGSMLSVPLPEAELEQLLTNEEELALAAVNGPSNCVVSGPHEAIDAFIRQLEEKGQQSRRLHTSHAFHSKMMDSILIPFEEKVRGVTLSESTIPFISNVTGKWITFQDAGNPKYWSRHLRSAVRFADGVTELLKEKNSIFIEVGPGRTLNTFLRQHQDRKPGHMAVNLVRHPKEEVADDYYLLNKIGQIWLYGKPIDWNGFYSGEKRTRLRLPTYPFERQRYWVEGNPIKMIEEGMPGRLSTVKKTDIAEWFYTPSWIRSAVSPAGESEAVDDLNGKWLVFVGQCDFGSQLINLLTQKNKNGVAIVRIGEGFAKQGDGSYTIDPRQEKDYETLLEEWGIPDRIVHLWNLTGGCSENNHSRDLDSERIEKSLDLGFYSLLYLARALGSKGVSDKIEITVLTDGMQQVWDEKLLFPEKAAVLGPVMIIPREFSNIKCRCIDIILPGPGNGSKEKEEWLIERLLKEFKAGIADNDTMIAYRGNYRLKRVFESMPLGKPESEAPRLREGGVYLITGGVGGIGLVLSRHLAKTVQAKLLLTGRSFFPARDEWEEWLNTHGSLDSVSQKIRKVKELESLGAEVLVYSVDTADGEGMRKVVEEARERFGTINGLIHAAGVPGGGMIQLKTRETADSVLAPKVKGTLALDYALQGIRPDFIILCSSINSVVPILGQVDYCAANAFLDAFAFYKNSVDKTFTVSINWDGWQEVGMAVEAAKKLTGDKYQESKPLAVPHPLLDHYRTRHRAGGVEEFVYTSYFSLNRHWVLSGHMTQEKKGLAPGVIYLEMARAAIENQVKKENAVVEIRNVSFLNPLIVGEGEEKEVRMILKQEEEGFEFLVRSRITPGENNWQNHAKGKVALLQDRHKESKKHDIEEIKARCNLKKIVPPAGEEADSNKGLVIFGPHWRNVKKVHFGKNEGLALLELPGKFAGEVGQYKLHPAILDNAASFLYEDVNRDSPYIPFSYKKLRISEFFPARLYSHSRLTADIESEKEFLRFNVILMDKEGRELVEIEEFTMLQITGDIFAILKEKEHGTAPVQLSGASGDSGEMEVGQEELVKNGISPAEGVDAFTRILAEALPQVVVSTRDIRARFEALYQAAGPSEAAKGMQETGAGLAYSRPEISSAYVAPANDAEQTLALIWQELLGIDQVGANDDFFELGGDSLKATAMISKIKKEFSADISVRDIFNAPRVKDLSKLVETSEEAEYVAIEPSEKREYYAVSSVQKRLYVLNEMEGISTAYNLPSIMTIEGKLDMQRMERTFRSLIERHESLKTSFSMGENGPIQIVHDHVDFHIDYIEANENEEKEVIKTFIQPFDLRKPPLFRVGVVKLSEDRHILLFDVHHIVCDGTSYMIMARDMNSLYEDDGQSLPELRVQYKDFSQWQNSELGKARLNQQKEYWLAHLKGDIPTLNISTDYPRPSVQSFDGERVNFQLDEAVTRGLRQLEKNTGTTLYILLLAALNVLLSKYSRQKDIIVGSPVAAREHFETENIIGLFINALLMRNYPTPNKIFAEFLDDVKDNTLTAYNNQGYPFGELIEELGIKLDITRNPLYDVELIVQNMEVAGLDFERETFVTQRYDPKVAQLDISLEAIEGSEMIVCAAVYCTKLFKKATIDRFIQHYINCIKAVLNNPTIRLANVDIMDEQEKQQLLVIFNDSTVEYPGGRLAHQLFEEQVEKAPDRIAVIGMEERNEQSLTYKKLNEMSDGLACLLMVKGVKASTIVALIPDRCPHIFIGVLGILKAGGAYLPIDPNYPEERIQYMLADSGVKNLVTNRNLFNDDVKIRGWEGEVVFLEDWMSKVSKVSEVSEELSTQPCYVIYTSGSTGKPKGVMVRHDSFVNAAFGWEKEYRLEAMEVNLLQMASFSFDVFSGDIARALLTGGKLVICPEDTRVDLPALYSLVRNHRITLFEATPSLILPLMEYVCEHQLDIPHLRLLILGSDVCPLEDFKRLMERFMKENQMRIVNSYGLTEATIDSSYYEGNLDNIPLKGSVPIGKPFPNVMFYILDPAGNLLPVGVPGELYIGGKGVALGYLNNAELTAEKFIESHRSYNSYTSYRTGDLARWLDDGNVEFLGRVDYQVKIRGFRVELGEIEARLVEHENIREAVVLDKQDEKGNKYLCAYIVPAEERANGHFTVSELRAYLFGQLPDYMIPGHFIEINEIPLTSNGKVDTKALLALEGDIGIGTEYAAPTNEVEETLVKMWSEILVKSGVGIDDNFFDLGGQSLKAMQLMAMIKKAFDVKIPLIVFFQVGTIRGIAGLISRGRFPLLAENSANKTTEDYSFAGIKFEKKKRRKREV